MDRQFNKTIAFIYGSGLAQGLEKLLEEVKQYKNIVNEFGTVLLYFVGYYGKTRIIILPRHGPSLKTPTISPAELVRQRGYEANIWQLYKLKVDAVYALSSVGVLDLSTPLASEGSFIIPHSYIRGFSASQHSFGNKAIVHPNMSKPFDEELRKRVVKAIKSAGYKSRDKAIYIYNSGDIFETKEEIAVLDLLTQQFKPLDRVIGMTTVPEAILLKQLKIPFVVICSNVNYAEGLSKEKVTHEQTIEVMVGVANRLINIIKQIIRSYN